MKELNPYVIVVVLLLLYSCTTDDETVLDNNQINLELSIEEITNNSIVNNRTTDINSEELKLNMQWMSYGIAEAIYENSDARQDFSGITAGIINNVISLEDLVGPNTSGDFKDAFYESITSTIQEIINDMYCAANPLECGAPEPPAGSPPPLPTGTGPGGAPIHGTPMTRNQIPTVDEVMEYLMNYVLNEHCLDIYIPKHIPNTGEIDEIATTYHPLSSAESNMAIILTNLMDSGENRFEYWEEISPSYLNGIATIGNKYVIITRPKRTRQCFYPEYSRIDFRDFFD